MVEEKREAVGRVAAYAVARLVPRAGSNLTAEAITVDYHRWCREQGLIAFRDGPFRAELARLAQFVDLVGEANDADTLYRDVAFNDAPD